MAFSLDYDAAQKSLIAALVSVTRTAGQIASEDPAFLRSSLPAVDSSLDAKSRQLLALTEKLIRRSAISEATRLPHVDSIETHWQSLVNAADHLLERADTALDEFKGYTRVRDLPNTNNMPRLRPARHFRDADIPKPQLAFLHPPNNNLDTPFKPLLTSKPHAVNQLEASVALIASDEGQKHYSHPYQNEIERYRPPPELFIHAEPKVPPPFAENSAIWVDSEESLHEMLKELKSASEIAVDLEHHDTHSYIGIVSLMQISTRERDWVVDTLKPWRNKLEALNEVFADPTILKVFHGSTMDIIWLQRDFGLYVVGLFDTYHAARALGLTGHSLAFLLKKYVDFNAQKQYQTADWRIRPLPSELLDYARSDTHFLLYIYDCMRNELLNDTDNGHDHINFVIENSKSEALQRHERPFYALGPVYSKSGWFSQLYRAPRMENDSQLAVFIAVHRWRDSLARQLDESPNTIMTNSILYNIVLAMPSDMPALLRASQPLTQYMRPQLDHLLQTIRDAKQSPEYNVKEIYVSIGNLRHHGRLKGTPLVTNPSPVQIPHVTGSRNGTVRAATSGFWGNAIQPDRFPNHTQELELEVPSLYNWSLQSQTANAESTASSTAAARAPALRDNANRVHVEASKRPSLLSKVLGKRNRETANHSELSDPDSKSAPIRNGSDPIVTHTEDIETKNLTTKAERKSAKKAAKMASKIRDDKKASSDHLPFDYENAPSLLDVGQMAQAQMTKPRGNPYAKAADTTESLKSSQVPRVGRSTTFK